MTIDASLATAPHDRVAKDEVRVALALGMASALGEELLAALVASPRYRLVHVALKRAIASAAAKYRPWVIGTSVIAADDAYVCVTGTDTPVPHTSPVQPIQADHVIEVARIAREAGVRRLVLVAPLSALLQMNAASHTVSSEQELELVAMKFESLLIVRPDAGRTGRGQRSLDQPYSALAGPHGAGHHAAGWRAGLASAHGGAGHPHGGRARPPRRSGDRCARPAGHRRRDLAIVGTEAAAAALTMDC